MPGLFVRDIFANQLQSVAWEANKSPHSGCEVKRIYGLSPPVVLFRMNLVQLAQIDSHVNFVVGNRLSSRQFS
jgi:hypothetical protein